MEDERYAQQIGQLMLNLLALEFIIRAYLHKRNGEPSFGVPQGVDILSLPVGTKLAINEVTSYDSLSRLIQKFNEAMSEEGADPLSTSIVDTRDAIAHGRVWRNLNNQHLRLVKFSKPESGLVRIAASVELTSDWLKSQTNLVADAIEYVHSRYAA